MRGTAIPRLSSCRLRGEGNPKHEKQLPHFHDEKDPAAEEQHGARRHRAASRAHGSQAFNGPEAPLRTLSCVPRRHGWEKQNPSGSSCGVNRPAPTLRTFTYGITGAGTRTTCGSPAPGVPHCASRELQRPVRNPDSPHPATGRKPGPTSCTRQDGSDESPPGFRP